MASVRLAAVLSTVALLAPAAASAEAVNHTKTPALYKNCTNFNAKYRHGVGRVGARDLTKSTTSGPVTNFLRNTKLYKLADHYNGGLDRDNDGVACEKH